MNINFYPINKFVTEVIGVDLKNISNTTLLSDELTNAKLLIFRDQYLDQHSQLEFCRKLGTADHDISNGHPYSYMTNLENNQLNATHIHRAAHLWHSDGSWKKNPEIFTVLYPETIASDGNTWFSDMVDAFLSLPKNFQIQLREYTVEHSLKALDSTLTPHGEATAIHPLILQNAIYIGAHARKIIQLNDIESHLILQRLLFHCIEPRFVYQHTWKMGDVLIWNNRTVMHRVSEYDASYCHRAMRRMAVYLSN
jgi:alpha-ketoglutarate-dependent taurine dioxygenase